MQRCRLLGAPRRRDTRGAAALEFALVAPILFLLLFGIIDYGYLINRSSMINNAVRDAAREGALHGSQAEVSAVATAALAGFSPTPTVAVTCKTAAGAACGSYDAGAESGGTVTVRVTYQHPMMTPVGSMIGGGDTVTVTRTATMRIE